MAKSKGCSVQTISFKKKRGGKVVFKGRPGGQKKHGGVCENKARKRTPQMSAIARAGRACKKSGRPGTAKNIACVRAFFRK